MIVTGRNKKLDLTIEAPPSKSVYHRELIVRFLCGDRRHLEDIVGDNDDIKATKACLRAMRDAAYDGNDVILPCSESGSTLRFMIPVAAAFLLRDDEGADRRLIFTTKGRLFDRPLKALQEALISHGITITKNDLDRTIVVTGVMIPGRYEIDGNESSQYISGLLMALPLFEEDSTIEIKGELKSVHYVELTLDALSKYGAPAKVTEKGFIPYHGGYKGDVSGAFKVEGDWSNGAFLLCLSKWSDLKVEGLDMKSRQGDKAIVDFLNVANEHQGESVAWDCTDTPDIAPYMAIVSPFMFDRTTLTGIERLRIKESDRLEAVREQLRAIGVKTEETEDSLTIYKYERSNDDPHREPVIISSYHDHRMAMCAILIAVILKLDVDIDDIECLNKSFPEFQKIVRRELMP